MIQQLRGSSLTEHTWNSFVAMAFAVGHEPLWQLLDGPSQNAAARRTQLFFQTLPVDPAKTVAAMTLPVISRTAVRGSPALHVFDLALG